MTNCFDLRCPKCRKEDSIDILAAIWVRLTDDGTDPDLAKNYSHEWHDQSHARCIACEYSGKAGDFRQNEYMAHFRTTAGPADDIFVADTPEGALELARKAFGDDPSKLGFSPAECGYVELQEIRIVNEDAEELLCWMAGEYRLQMHAPELLKALQKQIEATREIIDSWNNTDKFCGAVEDLISDLEHQSEYAKAVLEAHETSELGGAIEELEKSLEVSLDAIAQVKGGAA
jgi:hypothetical protein